VIFGVAASAHHLDGQDEPLWIDDGRGLSTLKAHIGEYCVLPCYMSVVHRQREVPQRGSGDNSGMSYSWFLKPVTAVHPKTGRAQ
jgi:hypothetical protein